MTKKQKFDFVQIVPFQEKAAFGPRLLDSYLSQQGFGTAIVYFKKRSQEHVVPSAVEIELLIDLLKETSPLLIGFSLLSPFRNVVFDLTRKIKENFDTPVIFGGAHATTDPDDCLLAADICCSGDGEEPLITILDDLKHKRTNTRVPNCCFKTNGQVIRNVMSYVNKDLDLLPYSDLSGKNKYFINDDQLFQKDPYLSYIREKKIYDFKAYRGCPHSCTYCGNAAIRNAYRTAGSYFRHRSVSHVIKELEIAHEQFPELEAMRSYDEVFLVDKNFIREFAQDYKAKVGLPLYIDTYVTRLDEEMVQMMTDAGLKMVTVGVEAFSQDVRKNVYKRNQSDQQILNGVALLAQYGVQVNFDLICDSPFETAQDMESAFWNLIIKFPRPCQFQLYSLSHLPRTELTNRLLEEGKISKEEVVGASDKALVQWKATKLKGRDPQVSFWIDMIVLFSLPIKFGNKTMHVPLFLLSLIGKTHSPSILRACFLAASALQHIGDGTFFKRAGKKLKKILRIRTQH